MTIEVTDQIRMVKWIKGKEYPIIVDIMNDGTMRFNVSKHPGSQEQLENILKSIADIFGTTYEVEKHIRNEHIHIHDDEIDKDRIWSGRNQ